MYCFNTIGYIMQPLACRLVDIMIKHHMENVNGCTKIMVLPFTALVDTTFTGPERFMTDASMLHRVALNT